MRRKEQFSDGALSPEWEVDDLMPIFYNLSLEWFEEKMRSVRDNRMQQFEFKDQYEASKGFEETVMAARLQYLFQERTVHLRQCQKSSVWREHWNLRVSLLFRKDIDLGNESLRKFLHYPITDVWGITTTCHLILTKESPVRPAFFCIMMNKVTPYW